jgi:hypothetical protein
VNKLKLVLIAGVSFIILMGGINQRHIIECQLITPSGYLEIEPNIFFNPSFNNFQSDELLSIISLAKSRINNTFGSMTSSAKVIITATENDAANLGSNAYGVAHLSALGQCIVLGPKGQNIDVIAHEYTHAEVHHRVGWINYLLNVPTWFNEGIATLVDFRKPYLLENIDLSQSEVNKIKSQTFNHADIKHYQAVRVLASSVNKSKLYENLEKVKQGQNINSVFAM